ncbi:MAG: DUF533 domain-containing protein [Myxococcota bacterium]
MNRVDEYLNLVDNPTSHALTPGHPADDAMLALLVHVAFSDGQVSESELAFLDKVLPGREPEQLVAWIEQVCAHPLDIQAVAAALPTAEERWKALRFAARMAWKDGAIDTGETALLQELAAGLSLGPTAVDRVLAQMQGKAGAHVPAATLAEAVEGVAWASVQVLDEPVGGPLASVAPVDASPVRIIALDDVVVVALYSDGLSAHFMEGTTFIPWASLVTYTRVPTFGAAVQLHTEEGGNWTLVDARLRGLTLLLDRLFDGERKEPAPKPQIVQVRGEEKG